MNKFLLVGLFLIISISDPLSAQQKNLDQTEKESNKIFWKAGVARALITPRENMWMSGYAAREKPAEGKLHDLWVKALAIEDEKGNRALFIATDIIGFSRELSLAICKRLQQDFHLDRSNILLSSSHTHSGPVVNKNLYDIYPPFDDYQKTQIEENLQELEDQVVNCAHHALSSLSPARISSGVGIARFAVNRRNNNAEDVLYKSDLAGPSDYTVPVLKVSESDGNINALVFGYACHATTLGINLWSGDYPGYAQIEIEKSFPGATALFFAGCAGDQNPIPRSTVPLAEQYGNELAEAVKRVLKEPMKELAPKLSTNYKEIELAFSDPLSIEELNEVINTSPPYQQRWASKLIRKIQDQQVLPESYPFYPVQSWQLGDQLLIALGGEVTVDYAINIKKTWGNDLFVAAYSNDVMAYIPTVRILEEGGYEGNTSMRAYGQPATWSPEIEKKILDEVGRQVEILKQSD